MTRAESLSSAPVRVLYDRWLLAATVAVISIGLTMVASASIVMSTKQFQWPFHYLLHQFLYFLLGISGAIVLFRVPTERVKQFAPYLLMMALVLLVLVLVPGIGRHVNGSTRWLGIGPVALQVSEFAKLAVVVYLASYFVRRHQEVTTHLLGFIKPMALLVLVALLLLAEPDFGATVVILSTALGMMFLAGVQLRPFVGLWVLVVFAMLVLAISAPYRMARLTTFLDPWINQFGSGYQLTQSLIAFGRGGWWGVGLGNSVQKLFYLPEAHTDFLFAVVAEELGLVGIVCVMVLYAIIFFRAFAIGRRSQFLGRHFGGYLAYGFGLWLGLQFIVNVGVNSGVLPTKGLTLPLMSYGGSSILIDCLVIGLLLRIDHENRLQLLGVRHLDELMLGKTSR